MVVKLASLRRGPPREQIVEMLRREETPSITDLVYALQSRPPVPREIVDYVCELLVEHEGKLPGGKRGRPKKAAGGVAAWFADEHRDYEAWKFVWHVEGLTRAYARAGHKAARGAAFAHIAEEHQVQPETIERDFRKAKARTRSRSLSTLSTATWMRLIVREK